MSVEDIVSKNKAGGLTADEVFSDKKGLGKPAGVGLLSIADIKPELGPILKQLLERREVPWRGDQQDIPNPREHKRTQRVINHGLIEDWEELLRNRHRAGIKPSPATSCEDNTLHHTNSPATTTSTWL